MKGLFSYVFGDLLKYGDLTEWLWAIFFSPIWVPSSIKDYYSTKRWLRGFLQCSIEEGWDRCSDVWKCEGVVSQSTIHAGSSSSHILAVEFGRYHANAAAFFIAQLSNADPLLAAYAFKCLIRVDNFGRDMIPASVFDRDEEIIELVADMGLSKSLGKYVEGYF